jgi:hypothetical protein
MPILRRMIRLGLIFVLLTGRTLLCAQTAPVAVEYQLKAVFLFNFTKFVEWPADAFNSDQEPFVIGVLGGNPFGSYLEDVGAGEKVNGHPLVIKYFKTLDEVKSCHILFVNKAGITNLSDLLSAIKGRSILTVSDASDFLRSGGMVRFYINSNNKVQLQMNQDAAKTARLQISSKLLRLTDKYEPK